MEDGQHGMTDIETLAREMFPKEYALIDDDHPMDPDLVQQVKKALERRYGKFYDSNTAVVHLQFTTNQAARFALGMGVDAETVALVLESLAHAIREPGDVAEDMTPIHPDEF